MKSKKGQPAMEFLLTYGWAILVVLAIIGVFLLYILPRITGGNACDINSEDLRCSRASYTSGQITYSIANSGTSHIELREVSFIANDNVFEGVSCSDTISQVVNRGKTYNVAFDCDFSGSAVEPSVGDVMSGVGKIGYIGVGHDGANLYATGTVVVKIASLS